MCKLHGNSTKNEDARVLHLKKKTQKTAVMTVTQRVIERFSMQEHG